MPEAVVCDVWTVRSIDIYSRRDAGNAEISIICSSGFSREYRQFAAEAAPTDKAQFNKAGINLCVPCASARKQVVKSPASADLSVKR